MIAITARIFNIVFFIQKPHQNYITNKLIAKICVFVIDSNNLKKSFFVLTQNINLFNIEQ